MFGDTLIRLREAAESEYKEFHRSLVGSFDLVRPTTS
jgi:hypothetical protein